MKHRRETEIKLPARDRKQVGKRLSQLGFRVLKPRHFESNCLFDFPDLRLSRSGCLLRLRFAGGEDLLTFKGPPLRTRRYGSRREIETRVEDAVLLREVLKNLGLKQVFVYEKYRTIYAESNQADFHELPQARRRGGPHARCRGGPCARPQTEGNKADHGLSQVAYDETPVGNYLELEGPEKWIDEVATRLGYSPQDYITSTYLALYSQKCREEGKKPGNMVFVKSRLGFVAA
jgi:adenylate cyclase class 2